MLTIHQILRPATCTEAQQLLQSKHNSAVLGGGAFMRLGSRTIDTAIDLQQCGLRYIIENKEAGTLEIGAMTTIRDLEVSPILCEWGGGLIPKAVSGIVGVQLRNIITVGGTIMGRYGFSELLTALLVLDCHVVMHAAEPMPLSDFLLKKGPQHQLFEKLVLRKEALQTGFQVMRNTAGSLPMLSVAVALLEAGLRISVGARPAIAARAFKTELAFSEVLVDAICAKLLHPSCSDTDNIGLQVSNELTFGDDAKCSGAYRKEICKTLVNRAILSAGEVTL